MQALPNPWRNKIIIRILAIVDMIFGNMLFVLYIRKLFWPISTEYGQVTPSYPLRLILLLPITINILQIVMAYSLLVAVKRKSQEPLVSMGRATMWFQVAVVILTLLCLKLFIMLLFGPNSRSDPFGVMLTLAEIVFKTFGLYVVKEFIDDLRLSLHLNLNPEVQYITIYPSGYTGNHHNQQSPAGVFV